MTSTDVKAKIGPCSSIDKRELVRSYVDENTFRKHLKRNSNMSISKLEDLIMCPIHLGMMEDPRTLSCGHAFCLNCLYSCLIRMSLNSIFSCPICRRVCEIDQNTVNSLPPSIATKQLTDYIVETKSKLFLKQNPNIEYISNESIIESLSTTGDQKRELVRHLIKEIKEYKKQSNSDHGQLNSFLRSIESPLIIDNVSSESTNVVVHSTNTVEVISSNYELMDVETIRENMKKYSEYKLLRDTNNSLINCYPSGFNNMTIADIKLSNHEPELIVWTSSESNIIVVKTQNTAMTEFIVKHDSYEVHPIYLKIYNTDLFFTGKVENLFIKETHYFLFQCSLSGEIIRTSVFTSSHETTAKLAGFHINPNTGKVFLALPDVCKIAVLSENLVESSHGYHLVDLHPSFITQNTDTAEIWASCPQDGKIIIIDEETGSYRHLSTDQIYNAIPSNIAISGDNRVMFLDCHQNRVFWVRKRNDFILIQRITFIGHHSKQMNSKIMSMVAVNGQDSLGRLLFSVGTSAYIVRPAKTIGGQNHKHLMCNIL